MILITDLEAEQQRVLKTPLGCTGSCNQGRLCDCAPDYEELPRPSADDTRVRLIFWRGVALMYAAIGLAFLIRWLFF